MIRSLLLSLLALELVLIRGSEKRIAAALKGIRLRYNNKNAGGKVGAVAEDPDTVVTSLKAACRPQTCGVGVEQRQEFELNG